MAGSATSCAAGEHAVAASAFATELDLSYDPTRAVEPLDTSAGETFTEEQPNSLTVDELRVFMAHARDLYPQHFAMLALGVATGRRPSELRPLRRKGATPDILWTDGILLIRQSQTLGGVVSKTKTGRRLRIPLPPDLLAILTWHVDQLPAGPMQDSDLLFPATTGGWRSPTCLDKPIRRIAKAAGISKHLSAKFMRRTFQDLGRAADVHDLVVRAISGHATRQMQEHYSSVAPAEMRDGLAKVVALAGFRAALGAGPVKCSESPYSERTTVPRPRARLPALQRRERSSSPRCQCSKHAGTNVGPFGRWGRAGIARSSAPVELGLPGLLPVRVGGAIHTREQLGREIHALLGR